MAPCPGFSDNPFKTRGDFLRAGVALLKPLQAYRSPGKARIKTHTATGTHFSEHSAQLEGFARPLWLLANLFDEYPGDVSGLDLDGWITGLKNGVDPASQEYWGDVGPYDQRMVEMESIAYTLLLSPKAFGFEDDPNARENLIAWLNQINGKPMPANNWRWFRIFVNLALTKTLGVPLTEVQDSIEDDLKLMDTFYLGDGWNSDGLWCETRKQADYYSGSFAIHFAQLLYVRLAPDYDPARTQRYIEQAKEFATGFWRYFSPEGAAIPFGRSLTYRFAFAGFWAACAQANITLPAPLDSPGAVKGLLLRHLRWWSRKQEMFNVDGTLSIGYTYPNLYMSEDYNSPQSVYWCLKTFIVAGLPDFHPFWTCEEAPYPLTAASNLKSIVLLKQPRQILCNTPLHHFLLSTGQHSDADHKGEEAKYGKLAYSSAFGLSVPVSGRSLKALAPDSTLSLSIDNGKSWKQLYEPYDLQESSIKFDGKEVPRLRSTYKPFDHLDLEVIVTLIPPISHCPGWHIRVHKIRCASSLTQSGLLKQLRCVDSGFSTSGVSSQGVHISEQPCQEDNNGSLLASQLADGIENWWHSPRSAFINSESGSSGVYELSSVEKNGSQGVKVQGEVYKPHANTNIMIQRSLIPCLTRTIDFADIPDTDPGNDIVLTFVTGVFAVERGLTATPQETLAMWQSMVKEKYTHIDV